MPAKLNFTGCVSRHWRSLIPQLEPMGPNAPFTLAILETIPGGGYMILGEWIRVVQSVLTRGQFLSWKADFFFFLIDARLLQPLTRKPPGCRRRLGPLRNSVARVGTLQRSAYITFPLVSWHKLPVPPSVPGKQFRPGARLLHL